MAKKQASSLGNTLAMVFGIAGAIGFQAVAPQFFGERGSGINFNRVMWAGIIGGGAALVGYVIGAALDKNRDQGGD